MKKTIICVLIIVAVIGQVHGQNNTLKAEISMDQISFMKGTWKGAGWLMTRSGKEYTTITEKAECKIDCNIMVVEGLGLKIDSLTQESKIVHEAFGVIFNDPSVNSISIRAYKGKEVTQTPIEFLGEKKIRWNLTTPNGGKVRFTIDFNTKNKWFEIGEFNRGGDQWVKFLEMDLTKIKD